MCITPHVLVLRNMGRDNLFEQYFWGVITFLIRNVIFVWVNYAPTASPYKEVPLKIKATIWHTYIYIPIVFGKSGPIWTLILFFCIPRYFSCLWLMPGRDICKHFSIFVNPVKHFYLSRKQNVCANIWASVQAISTFGLSYKTDICKSFFLSCIPEVWR